MITASPVAAEADLDLAVLADLIGPLDLSTLPEPQRAVLDVLLLRRAAGGPAPDDRTLGTAVASALAAAAPAVIVLDDAHHIDERSARALAFSLRRLAPGLAVLLVGGDKFPAVPTLTVPPLDDEALHLLVADARPSHPAVAVDLAVEMAGGRPGVALAVADHLASLTHVIVEPVPLPADLLGATCAQMADHPDDVVLGLAAVAALAPATWITLRSANLEGEARLALDIGLVVAVAGELRSAVAIEGQVAMTWLSAEALAELHERLARATTDPGQAARHRTLARGVPTPADAISLLDASCAALFDGDRLAASHLARLASMGEPGAQVAIASARVLAALGHDPEARRLLEGAASDEALAALAALDAAVGDADTLRARSGHRASGAHTAFLALSGARPAPEALALAERAFVELGGSIPEPHRAVARAARDAARFAMAAVDQTDEEDDDTTAWEGTAAVGPELVRAEILVNGDDLVGAAILLDEIEASMGIDAHGELRLAFVRSQLALLAGDWSVAERYAHRGCRLSRRIGSTAAMIRADLQLAFVRLPCGDIAYAQVVAPQVLADASGNAWLQRSGHVLAAVAALSAGDASSAVGHFSAADQLATELGIVEPGFRRHDGDHLEGLLALGRADDAAVALLGMQERADRTGRQTALAIADRGTALVAAIAGDNDQAVAAAASSLSRLPEGRWPYERARTLLTLGQILRRSKRRAEARDALAAALVGFTAVGAPAFIGRTHKEMARLGMTRTDSSQDLTEAERRVAATIAGGATVKEAAATLFVSPKTIEANLTRVYRKLGIGTRAELGTRWAELSRQPEPLGTTSAGAATEG